MSAHENSLDLDDNANRAISSPAEKETRSSTAMVDKIYSGSDVIAHKRPSTLSMVLPSTSFTKVGEGHKADEKFEVSPISDPNNNAATIATTAVTVTAFGYDKPALPNGSISNPLFNLENRIISPAEISTSVASSKETAKSAPVFGLEKAVPSKEGGPDASPVNFDTNQNVFKVPPIPFTTSSIVGGEYSLKFGASFGSQPGDSISFTTIAGSTGSMQKVRESDGGDAKTNTNTGFSVRASELVVSSAAPASLSTPPNSIFKFGVSSNQNNGSLASGPSFSSSFPSLISNNFSNSSNQNTGSLASGPSFSSSFPSLVSNNFSNSSSSLSAIGGISATAASTVVSMATSSTPVMATSSTSFFKFGASPVTSSGLSVSSSVSKQLETRSQQDAGIGNFSNTAFGSSSAAGGSTWECHFWVQLFSNDNWNEPVSVFFWCW